MRSTNPDVAKVVKLADRGMDLHKACEKCGSPTLWVNVQQQYNSHRRGCSSTGGSRAAQRIEAEARRVAGDSDATGGSGQCIKGGWKGGGHPRRRARAVASCWSFDDFGSYDPSYSTFLMDTRSRPPASC